MKIVRDIIRKNIPFLTTEQLLPEAMDQILNANLSGLPVMGDRETCVGFLSEHDCIPHILSGSYHCDNRTQVKDLMHKEPLFVSPESSLLEIAQLMAGKKPKVYPVIDNGKLVGLISRQDVLRALSAEMKNCVSYA